jgi:hypothetical protein
MFKPWETASGGFFNFWDQPSQYQQPRNNRRRGRQVQPGWWQ